MAVQVNGIKEIEEALKKMADQFKPDDIQAVLQPEGNKLADRMKTLVPVNTGRLKNTIKVLERPDPKFPFTVLVGVDYSGKGEKGSLSIPALASIVEYGASAAVAGRPKRSSQSSRKTTQQGYWRIKIGGKWVTLKERAPIHAQPFVRPAFDMMQNQIANNIANKLYKIAQKKGKELGFDAK